MKNALALFAFFLSVPICCTTQSNKLECQKRIQSLMEKNKEGLDSGINMLETSKRHWLQSDTLLEDLFSSTLKLKEINQDSLLSDFLKFKQRRKTVQQSWWKKATEIRNETGIFPELEEMLMYSELTSLNTKKAEQYCQLLRKKK